MLVAMCDMRKEERGGRRELEEIQEKNELENKCIFSYYKKKLKKKEKKNSLVRTLTTEDLFEI